MATLAGKLRGYEGGLSGVPFRALLLVTDTASRLDALSRHVRKEGFLRKILGCIRAELTALGIDAPLFLDLRRVRPEKSVLRENTE